MTENTFDIAIIGGGPVGLGFARLLKGTGLNIVLLEQQAEANLQAPKEDGRDIALTHGTAQILQDMGVWALMPEGEISTIVEAKVLNGTSSYALNFDSKPAGKDFLGYLVANYIIRKAVYEQAKTNPNLTLVENAAMKTIATDADGASITLKDGRVFKAKLAIGADSRFSDARRQMGISTDMLDFGRSVIVNRVHHEKPHSNTAFECFNYGMTVAVLPMRGLTASTVITVSNAQAAELMKLSPEAYAKVAEDAFESRLGTFTPATERHAYPLVATYAKRFYANRFALLGDAAVGMHPVTAHGFNFGLTGAKVLADLIAQAHGVGEDWASQTVLETYNRKHRNATRPLYLATNTVVKLFTDDRAFVRPIRAALLHLGNVLSPANRLITAQLTKVEKNKAA